MAKITITIEGEEDPKKIAAAIEAAQRALKPKPGPDGSCCCPESERNITYYQFGGGHCQTCGGSWY